MGKVEVHTLMSEIARKGIGIIFILTVMDEVASMGNRTLIFSKVLLRVIY